MRYDAERYCRGLAAARFALCAIALAMATASGPRLLAAASTPASKHQPVRATRDLDSRESAAAERQAIERAKRLLPDAMRYEIVLMDPELAPDPEAIRRLDAFTVTERSGRLRPKVYINRDSPLLQRAARGDDFYVKALAAVLVYECAHLAGAAEDAARMAEQRFLRDLIARGAMAEADGRRYLAQLRRQPPSKGQ